MAYVVKNIGFDNGDPRNDGVEIRGTFFRPNAAGALMALDAEFYPVFGYVLPLLEGLRSRADQEWFYDRYINRRPGWTVAAVPGTSLHGWAISVDFGSPLNRTDSAEHKWVRENAPRFGWEWTGANFSVVEPWHFDFTGINLTDEQLTTYAQIALSGGFLMALTDKEQKRLLANSDALALGAFLPNNEAGFPFGHVPAMHNTLGDIYKLLLQFQQGGQVNIDPTEVANALTPAIVQAVEAKLSELVDDNDHPSKEEIAEAVRDSLGQALKPSE